ncbi:hypothetical protein [Nocardia brasiliensis]|uniref:hypothetical protein n=1 Tax=Nocardia brasiliensis TaxID=37326 RepID=UPI003671C52E
MTLAVLAPALHLTMNTPAGEAFVQAVVPFPNFSSALRVVLFNFMAAALGVLTFAVTTESARVKRAASVLGAIAVAASLVAVVMFVAAPPMPQVAGGFQFDQAYAHLPGYAESAIAGVVFPGVLCPALIVMSVRAADLRSLGGWSLTLWATGLVAVTIWAWMRFAYFVMTRYGGMPRTPEVFKVTSAVAAVGVLTIFAGLMLSPVVSWVRARRVLAAIRPVYVELVTRWPGVRRQSRRGSSADEKADDRITELFDALAMESEAMGGGGAVPVGAGPGRQEVAAAPQEVAAAVSEWLVHARRSAALTSENIRAVLAIESDRRWAQMLAKAYRKQRKVLA